VAANQLNAMKALLPALFLAIVSVTAVFAKGGPAINDKCPVDGKTVRIIYRIFADKGGLHGGLPKKPGALHRHGQGTRQVIVGH
jgi:hypothetical protein